MSSITCPYCSRVGSLKAAVAVGTKVRCPGCQQRFEVQPEPLPDDAAATIDLHDPIDEPPSLDPEDAAVVSVGVAPAAPAPAPFAPSAALSPLRPSSPLPAPTRAQHPDPGMPRLAALMYTVAIFCFLAFAVASFRASGGPRSYDPKGYSHRFKDDNSYGATANALEFLADRDDAPDPAPWAIGGLLCLVVAGLDRLRDAVELSRRLG